jgi:hypothetical protein
MVAGLFDDGRIVERLKAGDGTFLVAEGGDSAVVAWQGNWHEVFAWVNDATTPTAEALSIFDGLSFRDSKNGLTVAPPNVPAEEIFAEEVTKWVPGVGMLHVLPGGSGRSLLPTWAGAETPAGEVWQKRLGDDERQRRALLFGTSSAVTIVMPEVGDGHDVDARLRFLDAVGHVSWNAA